MGAQNSIRPPGKPWEKGQSGNPGGRPKIPEHVKAAARAHTMDAINTLARICRSKKAPPAAQVSAAVALLDRGWGKPAQALSNADGSNLAPTTGVTAVTVYLPENGRSRGT